ncbi:MAG: alpha/beta hydrolase [Dethiosulfatibacter sp.]|nr:alpha/beta hydrolase [Dethiosulfatibacter sp.]
MGINILLTAIIVEISLAVVCFAKQSNRVKARNIIRIVSFAGFVLLAVLPVIDWSMRYYALATLLLVLAIIGTIRLIYGTEDKRRYSAKYIILKAIGMMVLFFVVTLPAIAFPQNKTIIDVTGDYQTLTKTYMYIDDSRLESHGNTEKNRKLNVQMWYPDNAGGKYPLIVFSHGGLGIKSSNESLYKELASHGYVVCSIDHTYHSFYTTDDDGKTTWVDLGYMKELFSEDPNSNIELSYEYYQKWMSVRTKDIDFVIDSVILESENNNADFVYTLIDTTKIGAMGHSLGGSAALGIARIRDDVSAVIALESPFMCDIESLENDQFNFTDANYPVPVLNVYSDSAWNILSERPQYKANYDMLTDDNPTSFNVHINGVGHLGLTDFALTSPLLTRFLDGQQSINEAEDVLTIINKMCLDFFDSYLKGAGEFTSSNSY